jgi:hypothetical protein
MRTMLFNGHSTCLLVLSLSYPTCTRKVESPAIVHTFVSFEECVYTFVSAPTSFHLPFFFYDGPTTMYGPGPAFQLSHNTLAPYPGMTNSPLEAIEGRQSAWHNFISAGTLGGLGVASRQIGIPFISPYSAVMRRFPPAAVGFAAYGAIGTGLAIFSGKPF